MRKRTIPATVRLIILNPCPNISSSSPVRGEKMPIYLGSWWRRARRGKATILPMRRASAVCLTVSTPASMSAPAAAKPDVNSAAKLMTTTESDSIGMNVPVTKVASQSPRKSKKAQGIEEEHGYVNGDHINGNAEDAIGQFLLNSGEERGFWPVSRWILTSYRFDRDGGRPWAEINVRKEENRRNAGEGRKMSVENRAPRLCR